MRIPILVWRFEDAPEELQRLSPHGGDEDWVAVLPPGVGWPAWAEIGAFGSKDVTAEILPDGRLVLIGAHA